MGKRLIAIFLIRINDSEEVKKEKKNNVITHKLTFARPHMAGLNDFLKRFVQKRGKS